MHLSVAVISQLLPVKLPVPRHFKCLDLSLIRRVDLTAINPKMLLDLNHIHLAMGSRHSHYSRAGLYQTPNSD
jgi:hypothetical protein